MAEPTHSYFDWQVSTLMLAYDVVEPLSRTDTTALTARQQAVEKEVHALALAAIPPAYRDNPQLDFPPMVVTLLTKATIQRAGKIVGIA